MKYTEGKWQVTKWASHNRIHISAFDGGPAPYFICDCGNYSEDDGLPYNPHGKENAEIICATVNACIKINPNNPIAAAEAIPLMYEALKYFVEKHAPDYEYLDKGIGIATPEGKLILKAREALLKAEGKEV